MSVVIVGGNERMARQYTDLCGEYQCRAKVYTKWDKGMKGMGNPDLLILFTSTVSHKMVRFALNNIHKDTVIARCHTSSISALKGILDKYLGETSCLRNW